MPESKEFIKALWSIGSEEEKLEVEIIYPLSNLARRSMQQYIEVKVMTRNRELHHEKLSMERPSLPIQTVAGEDGFFGLEGEIAVDFRKKVVTYAGKVDVADRLGWRHCPPPFPFRINIFELPSTPIIRK